MNIDIMAEMGVFLKSFFLGVSFSVLSDVLETLRKILNHGYILTAIEDLFFWLAFGVCLFVLVSRYNGGLFRGYIFFAILLGCLSKKQLKKAQKKVTILFTRYFKAKEKI